MNANGCWEYPKVQQLARVTKYFAPTTPVVVQEKLDGSNVSFYFEKDTSFLQSRTVRIDPEKPGMFAPFVAWFKEHEDALLNYFGEGVIVYGEMVNNQGKIKYEKTSPFVPFDVVRLNPQRVVAKDGIVHTNQNISVIPGEFDLVPWSQWGVEPVSTWYRGPMGELNVEEMNARIGPGVEGCVVKAYDVVGFWSDPETGDNGSWREAIVGGKVVREDFKELRTSVTSPKRMDDPLVGLADYVVTRARVDKAIAFLTEQKGMPPKPHEVISRVAKDVHDEAEQEVKDFLFRAYWPKANGPIAKKVLAYQGITA